MNQSVLLHRIPLCKRLLFPGFIIAGLFLMMSAATAQAQGDLLISPLRIIFSGAKRSQEINLANVGKDTATYAISIVNIRMKEDGGFEEITKPDSGQRFAGPYLRFFPRRVRLAPNEAQVVKMQVVRASQLRPGEYRSHLYFRGVPEEHPLGEQAKAKKTSGISIALKPIFGITIPVIIRVGDYNADVTLSNLSLTTNENSDPVLSFSFNRTGTMSVYGDVEVAYISPCVKSTTLKKIKGVGVYTPNAIRHFKVDLGTDHKINYHKGKLHVTYDMQLSNKKTKPVEAELELK